MFLISKSHKMNLEMFLIYKMSQNEVRDVSNIQNVVE